MSWLTPKRRRTTGNLRTVTNGSERASNETARPPSLSVSASGSPTLERPSNTHRPISQPAVVYSANGDGNLFYAYARKGNDLQSRYLLTFASASVANEWWLLVQIHFPDTTRPGHQLFSFQDDELLPKAWKHPSFAHLKSKWMYISFSNTSSEGMGGAAQGIIPVQDSQGNLVGGSVGSINDILPEVKEEVKDEVKEGVGRLEEYFAKMMDALEKNTQKAVELAARIQAHQETRDVSVKQDDDSFNETKGGYFDMDALSIHFNRLNELLTKNSQHVETLTNRHSDNDQKLRETMDHLASISPNSALDMQPLASHLDRIQSMIEDSVKERKDSARELSERPQQIDFSPLTQRLEKVQEAVEQNSALIKALLDEGTGGTDTKEPPPTVDLTPLKEHLDRIHSALEQQSEHTKALVSFASGEGEGVDANVGQDRNLAPLGEHLEQIYNAIEEGNKHARDTQQNFDLAPLDRHFDALREHGEKNSKHLQQIQDAIEAGNRDTRDTHTALDFSPLDKHFDALRNHGEKNSEHLRRLVEAQNATREAVEARELEQKLDLSPLEDHFRTLCEHANTSNENIQRLLEAQNATREAVEANGGEIDFTPLAEHLEAIRDSSETNMDATKRLLAAQSEENRKAIDFTPLTEHLQAIRTATEQNTGHAQSLVESQQASAAKSAESPSLDLSPLTDRLNSIHSSLEKQADHYEHNAGTGDAKFLMNALSSHLSKIQGITEQNATHVKSLREKQTSSATRMEKAVTSTSEQLQSLIERNKENEARIESQNSQMRELMSGQREMVEVMRQLARSVTAQNKGACDHIVVPPPRKMGRKVVGFVYDAKEGIP